MAPITSSTRLDTIDLEQVAQRLLQLAEIATREHLESLLASQAAGVLRLSQDANASN